MKATTHGVWDFTEHEWAAIDKAVRNVYYNTRGILPAHWQTSGHTRDTDPAAELRSWAYEYCGTHAQEIHERVDWQITHLVRDRLQQHLSRHIRKRPELPYGIGAEFDRNVEAALGGPGSPVAAPSARNPYEDALEPYKALLTPKKRRQLWEHINPGESHAINYRDPTGDAATESIYLEQLQQVLDTKLFHPGNNCKCEECVNILAIAA